VNLSSSEPSGFGIIHAGPTVIDDLAELIRSKGEGRAFVLFDPSSSGEVRTRVETVLSQARMSARYVDASDFSDSGIGCANVAGQLAEYAGGALVSVGSSTTIAAGKTVAALATNELRPGQTTLPMSPRTHIAIPVGLGSAEECTSLIFIDQPSRHAIHDDRLRALSVIDERLFPQHDPTAEGYELLAVVLASCTATDDSASLRDRTLALAAAHRLAEPDRRPVDVRYALTLAAAGHCRWPLCRRCRAGTALPATVLDVEAASPAQLCLQQAVARGLSLRQPPA
jgi:hypothetical protein